MPVRKSGPWYRTARSMWFANVQGKQTPLNVTDPGDRAGADAAFQALLAIAGAAAQLTTPPVAAPPPAPVRTVAQAVAGYLASCERRAAAGKISDLSIANYRRAMDALIADYGPRPLESLTAEDLEVWAARPTWSASTQNNYLGTVQQLFRWSRDKEETWPRYRCRWFANSRMGYALVRCRRATRNKVARSLMQFHST